MKYLNFLNHALLKLATAMMILSTCIIVNVAQAEGIKSNEWHFDSRQGYDGYFIVNQNIRLAVFCNTAGMPQWDHMIVVSKFDPKTDDETEIFDFKDNTGKGEITLDGQAYYPTTPTTSNFAQGEWDRFTKNLASAKQITVKVDDKTVVSFKPTAKSIKETISSIATCYNMAVLRDTIFKED